MIPRPGSAKIIPFRRRSSVTAHRPPFVIAFNNRNRQPRDRRTRAPFETADTSGGPAPVYLYALALVAVLAVIAVFIARGLIKTHVSDIHAGNTDLDCAWHDFCGR